MANRIIVYQNGEWRVYGTEIEITPKLHDIIIPGACDSGWEKKLPNNCTKIDITNDGSGYMIMESK